MAKFIKLTNTGRLILINLEKVQGIADGDAGAGSWIEYGNGETYPVTETPEQILALIEAAGGV